MIGYFLFLVLEKIGFNGPTSFFATSRGLRQGCLLSTLLYIIMAKSLSKNIEVARLDGSLPSLSIVINVQEVNHSQFTNDTLLLGAAFLVIASIFKSILDLYLLLLGGLINKKKCQLIGWNCFGVILTKISILLGFPIYIDRKSFSYLGIPISFK